MWLGALQDWNEKVRNLWYPLGSRNSSSTRDIYLLSSEVLRRYEYVSGPLHLIVAPRIKGCLMELSKREPLEELASLLTSL